MSRGVARLNDKVLGDCSVHGPNIMGRIITASPNTLANNRGVARLNDKVLADCGHEACIISAGVTVDNIRGFARLNDQVGNSPFTGKIISASPNTFINDSAPNTLIQTPEIVFITEEGVRLNTEDDFQLLGY